MHSLDDVKKQHNLDIQDMYHKIIHLPEQVILSYNQPKIHKPKNFQELHLEKITRIVICGMGGSAISGDIANAAFGSKLPISVVKDYNIPFLDKKTLVISISYSGNTEETLSCTKQAISHTKYMGMITSGGKLKEIAENKYCWIQLPKDYPPRSAIGFLFFSLMKILEIFEIIPDHTKAVRAVVANLVKKAGAICNDNPLEKNIAKNSAQQIQGKIPIIYSSNPQLAPLAYRWKCQFNENAKYPAFQHTFPEMNHNEIEGWEAVKYKDIFIPIILTKFNEEPQYKNRIKAFKRILKNSNIKYLEFFAEGDRFIEEIFSLIYLGDMISYYLAVLENVDPTKIDFIDFLKKEI